MDYILFDLINALNHIILKLLSLLAPFLIGLVIAYLLNPVVVMLEEKIPWRGLCVLITFFIFFAIIIAIFYSFIILIVGTIPRGGLGETYKIIEDYFSSYARAWTNEKFSINNIMEFARKVSGGFLNLVLGIIMSIYLLKDKEFFIRLWEQLLSITLSQKYHGKISEILYEIHIVLTTFIKGALVDSVIVALLSAFSLTMLKIRFSVILGMLCGILNVIPYFGPFFAMIPVFLVAYYTDDIYSAILAILILFIIQQIDSDYIYPKIVGNTIGLHPLVVLLSLNIFGGIWGIVGMILAIPIAGIIQIIIKGWALK